MATLWPCKPGIWGRPRALLQPTIQRMGYLARLCATVQAAAHPSSPTFNMGSGDIHVLWTFVDEVTPPCCGVPAAQHPSLLYSS